MKNKRTVWNYKSIGCDMFNINERGKKNKICYWDRSKQLEVKINSNSVGYPVLM